MRIYLFLTMALGASFIGSSCGGSGVGDPCVPEDEYVTSFSGFSAGEVNVESRSFQCLTRVCLVNHFQGRVSCPYGQSDEMANTCKDAASCLPAASGATSADHETSCRVPDRDGADVTDRIKVPVLAQLQGRNADSAVYCSCRCDGPEANARYCECPSGFVCEELVDDLGLGKGQLAGSYCIKEDTEYDEQSAENTLCRTSGATCGSAVVRMNMATGKEELVGVNPPNSAILSDAEYEERTTAGD